MEEKPTLGKRGTEGIRNSRCAVGEADARMKHEAGAEGRLGEEAGVSGFLTHPVR